MTSTGGKPVRTPRTPRTGGTIEVNGFAFRELRVRSGLALAACAQEVGISRPYLARIELGGRIRVSPRVFEAMLRVLQLPDRRALLSNPHEPSAEPPEDPYEDHEP